MPEQPDRPIEDQLKAWARKRRQDMGAPAELHPATRRLLQDEVARTFPRKAAPAPSARAGWLRLFRARLAWIATACAVIAIAAGLLLPLSKSYKSKSLELARLREAERLPAQSPVADSPARDVAAPSSPAVARSRPGERESVVRSDAKDLKEKSAAASSPAKADQVQPADNRTQVALADADQFRESKPAPSETQAVNRRRTLATTRSEGLPRSGPGAAPAASAQGIAAPLSKAQAPLQGDTSQETQAARAPEVTLKLSNTDAAQARGGLAGATSVDAGRAALSAAAAPGGVGAEGRTLSLARSTAETDRVAVGGRAAYYALPTSVQNGQRFSQIRPYRVNLNSPPPLNVLQSFQVERSGSLVHVVDDDGSIYDGLIGQATAADAAKRLSGGPVASTELKQAAELTLRARPSPAAAAAAPALPGQEFFRVEGTNVTLNQLVVFQGSFLAATNASSGASPDAAAPAGQALEMTRQQNGMLRNTQLGNSLIQGQVIVGGSNRMELQAAPVLRAE